MSVNRWEPANVLETLRTGLIDAVQVIYNIFDQSPEDELFLVCRELDIAVIARVPFDEGSLTGNLTLDSKWPSGDFRNYLFWAFKPGADRQRASRHCDRLPRKACRWRNWHCDLQSPIRASAP